MNTSTIKKNLTNLHRPIFTSIDAFSSLFDLVGAASSPEFEAAAAAAAAAAGGKGAEEPFGDPNEPNCIDKKYLVAACRSCSRSSAVCLLKKN